MISRARIQGWLEQLLHTHDTPTRTAFAYALGVFFGFSPILGLHTILGLILAFVFRLNRVAVLLGVYSNLPWILPAYYTVTTIAARRSSVSTSSPASSSGDHRACRRRRGGIQSRPSSRWRPTSGPSSWARRSALSCSRPLPTGSHS